MTNKKNRGRLGLVMVTIAMVIMTVLTGCGSRYEGTTARTEAGANTIEAQTLMNLVIDDSGYEPADVRAITLSASAGSEAPVGEQRYTHFYNYELRLDNNGKNDYNFGPNCYVEGMSADEAFRVFINHLYSDPAMSAATICGVGKSFGLYVQTAEQGIESEIGRINAAAQHYWDDPQYWAHDVQMVENTLRQMNVSVEEIGSYHSACYQAFRGYDRIPEVMVCTSNNTGGHALTFRSENGKVTLRFRLECGFQLVDLIIKDQPKETTTPVTTTTTPATTEVTETTTVETTVTTTPTTTEETTGTETSTTSGTTATTSSTTSDTTTTTSSTTSSTTTSESTTPTTTTVSSSSSTTTTEETTSTTKETTTSSTTSTTTSTTPTSTTSTTKETTTSTSATTVPTTTTSTTEETTTSTSSSTTSDTTTSSTTTTTTTTSVTTTTTTSATTSATTESTTKETTTTTTEVTTTEPTTTTTEVTTTLEPKNTTQAVPVDDDEDNGGGTVTTAEPANTEPSDEPVWGSFATVAKAAAPTTEEDPVSEESSQDEDIIFTNEEFFIGNDSASIESVNTNPTTLATANDSVTVTDSGGVGQQLDDIPIDTGTEVIVTAFPVPFT